MKTQFAPKGIGNDCISEFGDNVDCWLNLDIKWDIYHGICPLSKWHFVKQGIYHQYHILGNGIEYFGPVILGMQLLYHVIGNWIDWFSPVISGIYCQSRHFGNSYLAPVLSWFDSRSHNLGIIICAMPTEMECRIIGAGSRNQAHVGTAGLWFCNRLGISIKGGEKKNSYIIFVESMILMLELQCSFLHYLYITMWSLQWCYQMCFHSSKTSPLTQNNLESILAEQMRKQLLSLQSMFMASTALGILPFHFHMIFLLNQMQILEQC